MSRLLIVRLGDLLAAGLLLALCVVAAVGAWDRLRGRR